VLAAGAQVPAHFSSGQAGVWGWRGAAAGASQAGNATLWGSAGKLLPLPLLAMSTWGDIV